MLRMFPFSNDPFSGILVCCIFTGYYTLEHKTSNIVADFPGCPYINPLIETGNGIWERKAEPYGYFGADYSAELRLDL